MTQAVFIMLDGLRPDAISPERTPTIHSFMQKGSYTLEGQSVVPSVTVPCHTSIFHSVPPSRHGITDNNWHPMARPITGLVEHLKQHGKRTGFIHNWEFLRNLNSVNSLYYNFFMDTGYELDGDEIVTEHVRASCGRDFVIFFSFTLQALMLQVICLAGCLMIISSKSQKSMNYTKSVNHPRILFLVILSDI